MPFAKYVYINSLILQTSMKVLQSGVSELITMQLHSEKSKIDAEYAVTVNKPMGAS